MNARPASERIKRRVRTVANALRTTDPLDYIGGLIDRSFSLPEDDYHYAYNNLTPGAVPFEPSYSAAEPDVLRFTIEPAGPGTLPASRRDEATREMRRLVSSNFGSDALYWFDRNSEDWRSPFIAGPMNYGAFFGSAFDSDGIHSTKVYYEMGPGQVDSLPAELARPVRAALSQMPDLIPMFTTIKCGRTSGYQRATFQYRGPLRIVDLTPLMTELGMGHQLSGLMQIIGLALGGRFELPEGSSLIGISQTREGPELKLEVLLSRIPDVPASFLDLLRLGLAERPAELRGLDRWLSAYTPEQFDRPGHFSVLSIRTTPKTAARISIYLRPIEFEIGEMAAQTAA